MNFEKKTTIIYELSSMIKVLKFGNQEISICNATVTDDAKILFYEARKLKKPFNKKKKRKKEKKLAFFSLPNECG